MWTLAPRVLRAIQDSSSSAAASSSDSNGGRAGAGTGNRSNNIFFRHTRRRWLTAGHGGPRRRAVFVKVRSLNQDWRTGTLLIHLNLDIHKFSNEIRPLFEEVHWRQILFAKFCFRDNFEGIKPNGCQEFELIVFIVWGISKRHFDIRGGVHLHGDL